MGSEQRRLLRLTKTAVRQNGEYMSSSVDVPHFALSILPRHFRHSAICVGETLPTGSFSEYPACVLDLIELDGRDLRREPIEHRKHKLSRLVRTPWPGIVVNEHYDGHDEIEL